MTDYKSLYEAEVLKNEELQEQITCLESDSMNEVSQAEFEDMVEEKDDEIKRLIQKCNTSILKRKEIEKKSLNYWKRNATGRERQMNGIGMTSLKKRLKNFKKRLNVLKD